MTQRPPPQEMMFAGRDFLVVKKDSDLEGIFLSEDFQGATSDDESRK